MSDESKNDPVLSVAVVQAAPVAFDRARTLDKVAALTSDAAKQGAKLVVFPEAFVSAYPRGLDFGAVIGARSAEGREWYRLYAESSLEISSPDFERLKEIAAHSAVNLVIGVIERDGSTLHCSVMFFAPDGTFLGKHRKLMPTGSERLVWGQGDGSTLSVFDTNVGKVGAVICWENYMPLLRATMYAKGVEIYCAPTADGRETWLPSMRHIAQEGRVFVLSANQFCKRSDYPTEYETPFGNEPETIMSRGGSCIVGPLGNVIVDACWDREAILFAELDKRDLLRARYDFDGIGHYSRPDIFQLTVDERPRPVLRNVG
ncbi:carbon-nitrogen hydrolase family protein [Rhizobium mesosinicum]|uniref:Carbon-nitrogen hydrolase family protein n=1 Tax=Rhizobium mesosinicum TaxID=335017 RepID=A0ABS7GN59_9HYPH|nr:carbon-nitrogen hydrolase family protein [Rhizobium mesosinicum]